ncbi:bifunctional hydroxymethylpyrimidine kinase/phosphomethylpyrimidine kinase [Desulfovibrio cuneatus]|uniref:bifunctional hydroxymethylpyrimidine kinase/phosphomethylpyrimidine kinase n=1 Tax=Desulfovibrio cuneatus TaxID=159728 RepID=UPI000402A735|nr:bifunctional hydroxymethylpyrimidine kinase/phosphomethylpyrimidine kinase [Desulfovibrio cuneatus]
MSNSTKALHPRATSSPVILSIAGSDSGGGAGIQGDIKTISVLGGFAVTVITALTAQNGAGVSGVQVTPPDFVLQQLAAVQEGFSVQAAKTGMLATREVMEALAPALACRTYPLVVDPVCVSQSGHALLEAGALECLRTRIVPLADVLTPNVPEAEALTGQRIGSSAHIEAPIRQLLGMGAKAVLLKGGHLEEFAGQGQITDWLGLPDGTIIPFVHKRVETANNHGTGCALAAALATGLGAGLNVHSAVMQAQEFLSITLGAAYAPGIGAGPPNHMAWLRKR